VSAGRAVARRRLAGLIATAAVGLMVAASLSVSDVPDADAADEFLPAEIVGASDALVSNIADSLPWGVVGMGNWTHVSTNLRVPVFAIAEIGDRIFVGGMFDRAQRGPGGRTVDQSFLAAFDKATGQMIENWRPRLDASVYALEVTTDGKLIVGGDFRSINGQPFTAALAALDPVTGEVVPTWRSHLERPWSDLDPVVRALAVHDGHVYAAGNFSHHQSFTSRTRVHKAIRVTEADGSLDTDWLPQVTGAGLWALGIAPDGSRVTLGGYHSAINGSPETRWIGVVDGETGATIPGLVFTKTHSSSGHIQGIADTGDSLYYTGSQHFIFRHDTATWAREAGVTYTPGGDGQAIEIADGILYNACHCIAGRAWLNSFSWPTPSNGAIRRDANGIVAFTESDFGHVSRFYPEIYYENGDGPWDLHMDDRGCLWVGGDVFRLDTAQPYRWARGFTRLCRDDATAPTAPTGLAVTMGGAAGNQATITWDASTDDRGVVGYEVLRDGAIIATVDGVTRTLTDVAVDGVATYRVRALDGRGNRSATSDPVTASPPEEGAVLIAGGSEWRYLDDGSALPAGWTGTSFDDSAWSAGAGQLGFGDGDETTIVRRGSVQYWFRHTFTVADPTAQALELDLLVDDGAVVYLNGVELVRENMAAGPLGFPAWPTAWKEADTENLFTTYTVPADALVAGTNVVAVSVHNASANNGDLGFDLRLRRSDAAVAATPVEAVAAGSTWRYLDTGASPGAQWRAVGFDDSTWPQGPAQLGYGDGDEATVVQEGRPRHITHYFRHRFEVPNARAYATLELALVRDDGAVVYLNGVELVRDKMPPGPVDRSTLASDFASGRDEQVFHRFTVPADALRNGTNVVAVEIHKADVGSRDMSFDLALTLRP
jgi:trimeric autotransporter adhesin